MAHPAPDRLIPTAAREARSALLAALGTEHIPDQWMVFMETVTLHMPDILSSGRPSAAAIKHSVVGLYGFTSWIQMIEADIADGGFGWHKSGWKAYRRAWHLIEDYPWLKNERLTCSEVIQIGLAIKAASKDEDCFKPPENMQEAAELAEKIKADRVSEKETAAAEVISAQGLVTGYQYKRGRTVRRCLNLRNRLRQQAKLSNDRVLKYQQALRQARGQVQAYQQMSLWERVLAVFRGYKAAPAQPPSPPAPPHQG